MILFCRYGTDPAAPGRGFVLAHYPDGVPLPSHPGTVAIPYDGAIEALGKFGPEPALMGEAPSEPGATDNRRRAEDFRLPAAPVVTPAVLKAYLANLRYEREVAGIVVDGIPVATDRASQAAVEKLASRAARDPSYRPVFAAADGSTHALDAKAMTAIADRVSDRVDGLRARQAAVAADIDAGVLADFAAVDAALGA